MLNYRSLLFLVAAVSGCATTANSIHDWGKAKDYGRIRQELRKEPSQEVRVAAAVELGRANCSQSITDLVSLSRDPASEVRKEATSSLGHCAGAEVYNALIERTGDESQDVTRVAETVLRTWGAETVTFLLDALSNRNYRVRAAAVKVLGTMSDEQVGPALMETATRDDNSLVRREAVTALGVRNYAPAKKLLNALRNKDPSKEVALEAERALAKLGGTISDTKVLVLPLGSAEAALSRIGREAAEALSRRLIQGRLCQVLSARDDVSLNGPDLRKAALDEGVKAGADQVLYGTVERDRNRVTLTLILAPVGGGPVVQQEKASGYESDKDKLIEDLAKTFGSRYQ